MCGCTFRQLYGAMGKQDHVLHCQCIRHEHLDPNPVVGAQNKDHKQTGNSCAANFKISASNKDTWETKKINLDRPPKNAFSFPAEINIYILF